MTHSPRFLVISLMLATALLAQPAGYPVYPIQAFTWAVSASGTETWFTDDPIFQQIQVIDLINYDTPPTQQTVGASITGQASYSYIIQSVSNPGGTGYVRIEDITQSPVVTILNVDGPTAAPQSGSGSFGVMAGHTYRISVRAYAVPDERARINVSIPDHIAHTQHTATRSASATGSGSVNAANGEQVVGGFSADPAPQQGGTISGTVYAVSCNVTTVRLQFSDTHTPTTSNRTAAITAATIQPPAITAQPQSASVPAGGNVTLAASASGAAPLAYQWYFGSTPIVGATNSLLALTAVQTSMAGIYSVVVSNAVGSVLSNPASVTLSALAPAITSPPLDTTVTTGGNAAFAITAAGSAPLSYQWQRQPAGTTGFADLANGGGYGGATTASLTITSATRAMNGDQFRCVVSNGTAPNAVSTAAALTVRKADQTIAFPPLPDRVYGAAAFPLGATSSSGLTVSFSVVNGPAFIAGDTITLTGAGNVTVRASQAGDANFNAAPDIDRVLRVTKALLTVTAADASRTYGAPNPTFPLVYTGFVNGDTASALAGTPSTTTTATAAANVGSYPIVVTGGVAANYSFDNVAGVLNVAKATLTARADDKVRGIGEPNPPLTITYSGFVNGETESVIDTAPSISTQASATSGPGVYAITLSGGGDNNYALVLQAGTLTVGASAPVFTVQPASQTVSSGANCTFVVAASGNPAPTFAWQVSADGGTTWSGLADGALYAGTATVRLQILAASGALQNNLYRAVATNAGGTAVSRPAQLTLGDIPRITTPNTATFVAGRAGNFQIAATGSPAPTFGLRSGDFPATWARLDSATGMISGTPSATGSGTFHFTIEATNSLGSATQAFTLVVDATGTPPVITKQPSSQTLSAGSAGSLSVQASGSPSLSYQWMHDGRLIAGATSSTLALANAQPADAGRYWVVVSNAAGSVTSNEAILTITGGSNDGTCLGSFANSRGTFALFIRADRRATFIAYLGDFRAALVSQPFSIPSSGDFQTTLSLLVPGTLPKGITSTSGGFPFSGTFSRDGSIRASIPALSLELSGVVLSANGRPAAMYRINAPGTSGTGYAIAAPDGACSIIFVNGSTADAGSGTVDIAGRFTATTQNSSRIVGVISLLNGSPTITLTVTSTTGAQTLFAGADEDERLDREKLANLSTRSRVGPGPDALIAGFVISGPRSKTVLIRAVGPTLGLFGVAGVLAAPRLEIFSGPTSIAVATDWSANPSAPSIAAAAARAGAFALPAGSHDCALLIDLPSGAAYTAVVTGQAGATGVALLEVYDTDASTEATQPRLINISTRSGAGSGDATLVAGFVISGMLPKRVLIRGVGPALAKFGITGALARPQLALYSGQTLLVQNAGWETSADQWSIAASSERAGAFALPAGSLDTALIINLLPGAYTAQVSGSGGTGAALVEIYEVP